MSTRWLAPVAGVVLVARLAVAAGPEVHGASDVFSAPGVVVAWGVLRAPAEDDTAVVVRVILTDATFSHVRLYGVDPFTGERRVMAPGGAVPGTIDLRSLRRTFADHPRREIRLYRTADDWRAEAPALTIFYLGVPDTTPELTSEAALAAHLAAAVARATR